MGVCRTLQPGRRAIKQAISGEDILSIAITRVGRSRRECRNVGVVIDLACMTSI